MHKKISVCIFVINGVGTKKGRHKADPLRYQKKHKLKDYAKRRMLEEG